MLDSSRPKTVATSGAISGVFTSLFRCCVMLHIGDRMTLGRMKLMIWYQQCPKLAAIFRL